MDEHAGVRTDRPPTSAEAGARVRLPFRFDAAHRPVAAAWGITDGSAHVDVGEDDVDVVFGPWRLRVSRSNLAGVERTGPLPHERTTAPPAVVGRGHELVLATCEDDGLRLIVHEPVRCLEPVGPWGHESVVVTVADPATAARLLAPPV